jgi:hypothetical protein
MTILSVTLLRGDLSDIAFSDLRINAALHSVTSSYSVQAASFQIVSFQAVSLARFSSDRHRKRKDPTKMRRNALEAIDVAI